MILDAPNCESSAFSSAEFRRLLRIELLDEQVVVLVRVGPEACNAETTSVSVVVRVPDGNSTAQRLVAVADVDVSARPRVLALAIAELVRTNRHPTSEGSSTEPTGPTVTESASHDDIGAAVATSPTEGNPVTPRLAGVTPELRQMHDVLLAATWRMFASPRTPLLGALVAGTVPIVLGKLRLRGDLGGSRTTVIDQRLGSVDVSVLSGGVSVLFATVGRPALVLGPRIEFGYAFAKGSTQRSDVNTRSDGRIFIGASAIAGLHLAVAGSFLAFTEVEVGAGIRGQRVLADERPIASTTGALAGVKAGIGAVF
jgi:hypothetical protein